MLYWEFSIVVALCSLVGAFSYIQIWRAFQPPDLTPKGYGGALGFFLIGGGVFLGAQAGIVIGLAIIAVATAVYWLDDAFEVSARIRFAIQFATGFGVAWAVSGTAITMPLVGVCVAAGILNMVLTNIVNFTDGADLNFVVYPILTALLVLTIGPKDAFWPIALIVLAFTLPFAAINAVPKTLYFGDSGCFAFASVLTMMAVYYFQIRSSAQILAAAPTALPLFDAFWVFITRLTNREDLLSRNYHHLYQKLQQRFTGFGYLVPQFLNVAAVIGGTAFLMRLGLGALPAAFVSAVCVTPVLYAIYKRGVLQGPWHFGTKQPV